jgi:hypothetical protein
MWCVCLGAKRLGDEACGGRAQCRLLCTAAAALAGGEMGCVPAALAVKRQVIACVLCDLLQMQMKCFVYSLPCATALAGWRWLGYFHFYAVQHGQPAG